MREIDDIEAFEAWDGCAPVAFRALDLRAHTERLSALVCPGSLFLGCQMEPRAAGNLVQHGAWVVPEQNGRAFPVHRARLYSAEELYDSFDPDVSGSFEACLDQRIYREYVDEGRERPASIRVSLARRLHDHSITEAMDDLIEGRRVVAVMGGHGLVRSDPVYREVVLLAKALAERSYLVSSGGGPGAMEASHLGVWLAGRPDEEVDAVLGGPFAVRPSGAAEGQEYADVDWLSRAWRVRSAYPRVSTAASLGIPTWLYGHEPPTPFATHIAKFFANSVREASVLAIATHGVVFAPGSAGTTQEIFQDACQNHYGTVGSISPMILLGGEYWKEKRPVWPLLHAVSREERYGDLVALVDTAAEAVRLVQRYQPLWYRVSDDAEVALETELRRSLKLRDNVRFPRVGGFPSGAPLGMSAPRHLASWLDDALGDDWVDASEALDVWTKLLARPDAPEVHKDGATIGFRWGDKRSAWGIALDD